MQRIIKIIFCAAALAMGWQQARGFALLGPLSSMAGLPAGYGDSWEVPAIGYDLPGDVGTPKNIGQGYRRNIPVMYYAFNASFSTYFGVTGEQAVDSAMAILSNSFTNNGSSSLDGYSVNLSEFPDNSQSFNFTAEALGLTDLKSTVLYLMAEQLGLEQPERFVWTLHDRFLPPNGKCPLDEEYTVVQRNFDDTVAPALSVYSSYINDTLYTYEIEEFCSGPPPIAVAVPLATDPFADTFTAVAGLGEGLGVTAVTEANAGWASPETGGFYTGLTRDDVAGLRYLMTSNNIVFEDPGAGSQLAATNFNTINQLVTSDLASLLSFARTNSPFAVSNAFPGLQITSSTNFLVQTTNGFVNNWAYTFGNIVILNQFSNAVEQSQTISVTRLIGAPVTTPPATQTNVSYTTITLTNISGGNYFIIPPGSCGLDVIATNPPVAVFTTNLVSFTNDSTGFFPTTVNVVTVFTNETIFYYACALQASPADYYQGIGHIQFVRVPDNNLDSFSGNFRTPLTNTYTMVSYNPNTSQLGTRSFQRIVTRPDFMFAAEDLASPAHGILSIGVELGLRNVNFDVANIIPNLAGPGTINPPTTITLNEVGDIFGNGSLNFNLLTTNSFLSQVDQGGLLAWASFDATTNAPVVYPDGNSLQELENQLVIAVTPTTLPDATNGVAYVTQTFSATGGQPTYTWSLGGTQLPQGLVFINGVLSGTPFNNPTNANPYDFNIQLTDQDNRTVTLPYSITIH